MKDTMHLYILFKDGRIEHHLIKRFSDLSQEKSIFFYYEKYFDDYGKGTCFKRADIDCFEINPYELKEWEDHIERRFIERIRNNVLPKR